MLISRVDNVCYNKVVGGSRIGWMEGGACDWNTFDHVNWWFANLESMEEVSLRSASQMLNALLATSIIHFGKHFELTWGLDVLKDSFAITLTMNEIYTGMQVSHAMFEVVFIETFLCWQLKSSALDTGGPFLMLNALRMLSPGATHTMIISFTPNRGRIVSKYSFLLFYAWHDFTSKFVLTFGFFLFSCLSL